MKKNKTSRILILQPSLYFLLFLILSFATVVFTIGQTHDPSMQMPMGGNSERSVPWDNAQIEEGKSTLLAGKLHEAIAALTPLVKQYPGDARIPYTLATIYWWAQSRIATPSDPA
jgi:hypothetical protein